MQAASVLADLDLFALLRTVGHPTHTGSSALGLMVARDIDVTTVCPSIDPVPIFDLGRSLATHPRVRRVTFRDDTGRWNTGARYPDGLYWMVEYVADPDVEWKLDLWFLLDGTTQFDLEHMKTLPVRLTPGGPRHDPQDQGGGRRRPVVPEGSELRDLRGRPGPRHQDARGVRALQGPRSGSELTRGLPCLRKARPDPARRTGSCSRPPARRRLGSSPAARLAAPHASLLSV